MKITSIKQQVKRADRYSVYVDESYAFSLSEQALLDSKLASGQELSPTDLANYKQLSADDKLYQQALRYIAMRMRTTWEVENYLQRKKAPPPLTEQVIEKLTRIGLLDDATYAKAFVADRRTLRAQSKRRLTAELRKRRVSDEIIQQAIGSDKSIEQQALRETIIKKQRQTKYQDPTKLMQYLARQGFGYDDIKTALQAPDEDY